MTTSISSINTNQQQLSHNHQSHNNNITSSTKSQQLQYPTLGPYLLIKTIGEGEFGKVKLAEHKEHRQRKVAIKLIKKETLQGNDKKEKLMREISILKELDHSYIVKLYEVLETSNYIGMVMEYASGGELFEYILLHRYLKEKDAAKFFAQLICGVHYLHLNNIVHRDLKLENLLLDERRNIIVTDFGFANRFSQDKDHLLSTSCGSPCYAAPEIVTNDTYVGESADIWSCGVILYAMLAGYLPYDDDPNNPDGDNINLLYKNILETKLDYPKYISPLAQDLISIILVPDPKKRATMKQILNHPWLELAADVLEKEKKRYETLLQKSQKTISEPVSASSSYSGQKQTQMHHQNKITSDTAISTTKTAAADVGPVAVNASNDHADIEENNEPFVVPSHQDAIVLDADNETLVPDEIKRMVSIEPLEKTLPPTPQSTKPHPIPTANQENNKMEVSVVSNNSKATPAAAVVVTSGTAITAATTTFDHNKDIDTIMVEKVEKELQVAQSEHEELQQVQPPQQEAPIVAPTITINKDQEQTSNVIEQDTNMEEEAPARNISTFDDLKLEHPAPRPSMEAHQVYYSAAMSHNEQQTSKDYPSMSLDRNDYTNSNNELYNNRMSVDTRRTMPEPYMISQQQKQQGNNDFNHDNRYKKSKKWWAIGGMKRNTKTQSIVYLPQPNNSQPVGRSLDQLSQSYLNDGQQPQYQVNGNSNNKDVEKDVPAVPNKDVDQVEKEEQERNLMNEDTNLMTTSVNGRPSSTFNAGNSIMTSRISFAASTTAGSQYYYVPSSSMDRYNHGLAAGASFKMRYHHGPIDKNALTSKNPLSLVLEIQQQLIQCGYQCELHARKNFKMNVVKPKTVVQIPIYGDVQQYPNYHQKDIHNVMNNHRHHQGGTQPGILRSIADFQKGLMTRIKYMAEHGSGWNKGFDGKSHVKVQREMMVNAMGQEDRIYYTHPQQLYGGKNGRIFDVVATLAPVAGGVPEDPNQKFIINNNNLNNMVQPEKVVIGYRERVDKEIVFSIEIQKIRNLRGLYVVDFKRKKGDVWEFKKLYQGLIIQLPLGEDNHHDEETG